MPKATDTKHGFTDKGQSVIPFLLSQNESREFPFTYGIYSLTERTKTTGTVLFAKEWDRGINIISDNRSLVGQKLKIEGFGKTNGVRITWLDEGSVSLEINRV